MFDPCRATHVQILEYIYLFKIKILISKPKSIFAIILLYSEVTRFGSELVRIR